MATAKKTSPAKTDTTKPVKATTPVKAKAVNAAFMKALTPSPALAAIVGATPLPRTEVVKQLWVYIKTNKLQDATNKRNINADAKLKKVFDQDQVSMFQMSALISKHLS